MENSTVANVDQKDASLYVSFAELDDELVNMASIQKKNLQEFKDLRDAIKNSPAFNLACKYFCIILYIGPCRIQNF